MRIRGVGPNYDRGMIVKAAQVRFSGRDRGKLVRNGEQYDTYGYVVCEVDSFTFPSS